MGESQTLQSVAFKSFPSSLCLSSWHRMPSPLPHVHQPWRFCGCSLNMVYCFFTDFARGMTDVWNAVFLSVPHVLYDTAKNSTSSMAHHFLSASLSIHFMYKGVCYGIIRIIMWFPEFDPFTSLPQKRFSKGMNHFCGGSSVWFNIFGMNTGGVTPINLELPSGGRGLVVQASPTG